MNFSDILKSLNQASAFELFRLNLAIDQILAEPRWTESIRSQLSVGQEVEYFSVRNNKLIRGTITKLERNKVHVRQIDNQSNWTTSYASINLNGVDTQIRNQTTKGLTRTELAIGDRVSFKDNKHQELSGVITRLNPKSVSLLCTDNSKWTVHYCYLYRVMDAESSVYDPKLLGE